VAYETYRPGPAGPAGLGIIPLIIGAAASAIPAITGGSAAKKAAKAAEALQEQQIAAELKMHKRELEATAATGRQDSATAERSKVLKYALLGVGGIALLGAGVLWFARRKNPPGRRRRAARRRRRWR
jgi:hypothetical protein